MGNNKYVPVTLTCIVEFYIFAHIQILVAISSNISNLSTKCSNMGNTVTEDGHLKIDFIVLTQGLGSRLARGEKL